MDPVKARQFVQKPTITEYNSRDAIVFALGGMFLIKIFKIIKIYTTEFIFNKF